jgi:hypothetical protein
VIDVATPVIVRTPLGSSSTYTPGNETATGMMGSSRNGPYRWFRVRHTSLRDANEDRTSSVANMRVRAVLRIP